MVWSLYVSYEAEPKTHFMQDTVVNTNCNCQNKVFVWIDGANGDLKWQETVLISPDWLLPT